MSVPVHARPRVLLVLADHLTLADVTRPDLPGFAQMCRSGQMTLMSPGLAHGADPTSGVYATLGAGDAVRVGDVSQGLLGRALRDAGRRTALIGEADGDDTGPYRPALALLPMPDQIALPGTVPDPTVPGGRRVDPAQLWTETQGALRSSDLVVVHFGDFARAEREKQRGFLLPAAYRDHRRRALERLDHYLRLAVPSVNGASECRLLLVSPAPPLTADGTWDSLTPLLFFGNGQGNPGDEMDSDPHPVLWSATTQTWGLVAARDVAPTILGCLGVRVPVQMTGAAVEPAGLAGDDAEILPRLRRMDRQTRLNQQAQNPLFWGLGLGGAAVVFLGLGLYLIGRLNAPSAVRGLARYSLRLLSAWPLALLLAPRLNPATLPAYLSEIALVTAALALLPSPALVFSVTALVLVGDGLTGTTLVAQSVLSAYALAGIRFYGIGNEYMGVLLGGALLLAASLPPGVKGSARVLALWFVLVTFVLSFPAFGAKAGGAVTATVTFVLAWLRLRGVPTKTVHVVGSLLAGFVLVFVWAAVGHLLAVRRTHIDVAVGALSQGRLGYILGVAVRKVGLALHVLAHPGTLLGLLGFFLVGLTSRLVLRGPVAAFLARHPRFAAVGEAGLWGALAALLFNDSGIVAAILLLSGLLLTLLHGLFQEIPCVSLPWTSAKSVSESPSATA